VPWLAPLAEMPEEFRSAPEPAGGPDLVPESAAGAVEMVLAGLSWLAAADPAGLPAAVQADCLRGLERAAAVHTAARTVILRGFAAHGGYHADGHKSPRAWLTWATRVTGPAAGATLAWDRRLAGHPAVAAALASAAVSCSWARQICDWTDELADSARDDADAILLAAAAGGAGLDDLAALFEEMRNRAALRHRGDPDDGFDDRALHLATTLGGAGVLTGTLTSGCAAALAAVLDSLSKRTGPEDIRTPGQRRHDALEEACRRLTAAGTLPDRAGQPVHIQLHMTLDQLLARLAQSPATGPGSTGAGAASWPWPWNRAGSLPHGAVPQPAAPPGADCDATIIPIVTGRLDHALLDRLTSQALSGTPDAAGLRDLIARHATALLSGPDTLTSWLRTRTLPPPASAVSLPLDIGTATDTIPAHLRRAVITRDRHCAYPGCTTPPAGCQVHHIIPRTDGGPTKLTNLLLLCTFHHLILIHRWNWTITLNADGTTTARSPAGRVLHSHSPPQPAAA
jgi:Domain of unknown function (DUF222)/HNH endonuclease